MVRIGYYFNLHLHFHYGAAGARFSTSGGHLRPRKVESSNRRYSWASTNLGLACALAHTHSLLSSPPGHLLDRVGVSSCAYARVWVLHGESNRGLATPVTAFRCSWLILTFPSNTTGSISCATTRAYSPKGNARATKPATVAAGPPLSEHQRHVQTCGLTGNLRQAGGYRNMWVGAMALESSTTSRLRRPEICSAGRSQGCLAKCK